MDSSGINALRAELGKALESEAGVAAVYLFGSLSRGDAGPADADLVVVYGPPLTPATAPDIRPRIEAAVSAALQLPAHLMFFSEAEANEPGLLSDLQPELVFGADVRAGGDRG